MLGTSPENWIVTLGRFDINYASYTFARYITCPRMGHFQAGFGVLGCLKGCSSADITHPVPQGEAVKHNWIEFYPGIEEESSMHMLPVKGKSVMKTYVDADHASCQESKEFFDWHPFADDQYPNLLVLKEAEHL